MALREDIIKRFNNQLKLNGHLLAVAVGSGSTAKYVIAGGADFLLALNAGLYRKMGQGSLAALMPFDNSNSIVYSFSQRELLPISGKTPVIFGLCASDPMIRTEEYIRLIKEMGCVGINNYPTVSIIDGKYRQALEEAGMGFDLEVEAIRIAAKEDLFTVAFVYDEEQTMKMLDVGADMICINFGFTSGGLQGAKYVLSLQASAQKAGKIFDVCDKVKPGVFKMIYGGSIHTPMDVEYMYNNTSAMGYIGGSVFERLPTEKAVAETTQSYKAIKKSRKELLMSEMLNGISSYYGYVDFIKEYISVNYMNDIRFQDLADVLHVSRTHLSRLFNNTLGCTFPEYLNNYRLGKAQEMIANTYAPFFDVATTVGYKDYAHFSKIFKKRFSLSPQEYRARNVNKADRSDE